VPFKQWREGRVFKVAGPELRTGGGSHTDSLNFFLNHYFQPATSELAKLPVRRSASLSYRYAECQAKNEPPTLKIMDIMSLLNRGPTTSADLMTGDLPRWLTRSSGQQCASSLGIVLG
jgi:hypothetical protein